MAAHRATYDVPREKRRRTTASTLQRELALSQVLHSEQCSAVQAWLTYEICREHAPEKIFAHRECAEDLRCAAITVGGNTQPCHARTHTRNAHICLHTRTHAQSPQSRQSLQAAQQALPRGSAVNHCIKRVYWSACLRRRPRDLAREDDGCAVRALQLAREQQRHEHQRVAVHPHDVVIVERCKA